VLIEYFFVGTWSPAITVRTLILTLISEMGETTKTLDTIESSEAQKRDFAKNSWNWNVKDATFCRLFPKLVRTWVLAKVQEDEDRDKKEIHERAGQTQNDYDDEEETLESMNENERAQRKRQCMNQEPE
jgi:hypothetical protein